MNTKSQIRTTHPPTIVIQRVIAVIALGIAFVVMGSIFIPRDTTAEPGMNSSPRESSDRNSQPGRSNTFTPAGIPNTLGVPSEGEGVPPVEAWGDVTLSSAETHGSLPLLGSLQSDNYRTLIFGTEYGPRYTVYTKNQKEPIAVLLDLQTLAMYFRDVPMPDLAADATQLMIAETETTRDPH